MQVGNQLADLHDGIVTRILDAALYDIDGNDADGLRSQVALIPHGGYGRRDLAPFSDIDLLLLHSPRADRIEDLARRMLADLSDVGLDVGFATRTPKASLAVGEDAIRSFLLPKSNRASSPAASALFNRYMEGFRRRSRRQWRSNLQKIEKARREERGQYGETVYLLEPNVKRSRGGLQRYSLFAMGRLRSLWRIQSGKPSPSGTASPGRRASDSQSA